MLWLGAGGSATHRCQHLLESTRIFPEQGRHGVRGFPRFRALSKRPRDAQGLNSAEAGPVASPVSLKSSEVGQGKTSVSDLKVVAHCARHGEASGSSFGTLLLAVVCEELFIFARGGSRH